MNRSELDNLNNYVSSLRSCKQGESEIKNATNVSQFREQNFTDSIFSQYTPTKFNFSILSFLRESFPILDNGIKKYKSLLGNFTIETENEKITEEINTWSKNILVNYFEHGSHSWIKQLLDSALEFGGGIGEVIINKTMTDIQVLKNDDVRKIRFSKDKEGNLLITQTDGVSCRTFANQDLIHYLGIDYRSGNPYGYPLYWGMPFIGQIFTKIVNALNNQLIRVGDPFFFIALETGKDNKYKDAVNSVDSLKQSWDSVQKLRTQGKYGDIFAVPPPDSKWSIKAVGNDLKIFDLEIPTRIILEQACNATDFPPFFLYLHFGDNYNITTHQNDAIVNNVTSMRLRCESVIKKLYDTKLALMRKTGAKYEIKWNAVNLRDEKNEAEVAKLKAEAERIEAETRIKLLENGLLEPNSIVEWTVEKGLQTQNKLEDIYKVLEKNKYRHNIDYSTLKLIKKIFNGVGEIKDASNISVGII